MNNAFNPEGVYVDGNRNDMSKRLEASAFRTILGVSGVARLFRAGKSWAGNFAAIPGAIVRYNRVRALFSSVRILMQTLVAEDVRRIVNGGERFLLVDLTDAPAKTAAHVSLGDEFVGNVLQEAGQTSLPIIIRGTEAEVAAVERAAEALRQAGCLEVWTYFESWPTPGAGRRVLSVRHNVVSDPDFTNRFSHDHLIVLR